MHFLRLLTLSFFACVPPVGIRCWLWLLSCLRTFCKWLDCILNKLAGNPLNKIFTIMALLINLNLLNVIIQNSDHILLSCFNWLILWCIFNQVIVPHHWFVKLTAIQLHCWVLNKYNFLNIINIQLFLLCLHFCFLPILLFTISQSRFILFDRFLGFWEFVWNVAGLVLPPVPFIFLLLLFFGFFRGDCWRWRNRFGIFRFLFFS